MSVPSAMPDLSDQPFSPDAFPLRQLTVPQVLRQQAQRWPTKAFLTELHTGRRFTLPELHAWSSRLAAALRGIGVERGQHVGVLMENSAEHLALFLAVAQLGAVWAPMNTAARGELLTYYLSHADCATLLVDTALQERLDGVLPQLPELRRLVLVSPHGETAPVQTLTTSPGIALHRLHELGTTTTPHDDLPEVQCHDLLMLAFTSGTTGPSKASMLSHAAALTYGTGAAQAQVYRSSDVFFVCLPMFHNNALLASIASALVCGGSVVLAQRFSVSRFWPDIREHGCTITNLLGAMSNFLWSQPPIPEDTHNRLRLVSMAPVPSYAREFEQRFGLHVMSNYGLSDFGMGTSFTDRDPKEKLGSIGRPRAGMQMRIVDEFDFEVPDGQPGEIVMRADEPWRATTGYYKMPAATVAAHRNQWFHTGDRGIRDADGYFWFVDRQKDCIRRRGENISAFEVEKVLMRHDAVAQAAVFPVRTTDNDEEVGAVIVRQSGAPLSEAELIEFCQRHMAYFMVPRYLAFADHLPTTTNQKVEKFRLKQGFEQDLSQVWDREAAGIVVRR